MIFLVLKVALVSQVDLENPLLKRRAREKKNSVGALKIHADIVSIMVMITFSHATHM